MTLKKCRRSVGGSRGGSGKSKDEDKNRLSAGSSGGIRSGGSPSGRRQWDKEHIVTGKIISNLCGDKFSKCFEFSI